MVGGEGNHTATWLLLAVLAGAIGLHVHAVKMGNGQPSRLAPVTSLSPDGSAEVPGSQSSRIKRLIRQ
jgi:hypothetical protein